MPYVTQAELIDRFGETELAQLSNRVDGQAIDSAVLARAMGDADAEIDGYLGVRYALPLSDVPPVLVRLAADLTRYRLHDDGATETVRQRYQDAVSLLKRLASGDVQLIGASALPTVADAAVATDVRAPAAVFGPATLAGY